MNLDEAQRSNVAEWIRQGLKLSEIQNRLAADLGVRLTYMEVRLLVDDLKLTPKDAEPPKPIESVLTTPAGTPPAGTPVPGARIGPAGSKAAPPAGGPGRVSLVVDQIARPGAVVSGKVTFSDGNTAAWQINELGQLALAPHQSGYRPPNSDLEQFRMALEAELSKLGL
ncbi:MAG TPA: hypothetical protein P5205_13190 [Candidatus Paceibacterota bacterium]|nr:hypothetical protein [Verrucomicrobiota bacterium]HSA11316.1 hypothetical protein [Candidatus Paceibacterota bacterium]